jgi:hypothetical protein
MQRRRWAESRSSGTTVAQAFQDSDRLRSGVRRLDLTCTPVYVRSTEGAHRHLGCANFVVGAVVWERFNKSKKASVGCRPAVFQPPSSISVKIRTHASHTHQPD